MKPLLLIVLLALNCGLLKAQDSTLERIGSFPLRFISRVETKVNATGKRLEKQTAKALRQVSMQEEKLYRRMRKTDSLMAERLFGSSIDSLRSLQNLYAASPAADRLEGRYFPEIDSLQNSVSFLQGCKSKIPGGQLKNALTQTQALQGKLQQSEKIKQYLQERREILKAKLLNQPFAKKYLAKINKSAYYYGQAVSDIKATLADRKKLEQKAMALLRKIPAFQSFMQRNSQLAGLFNLPDAGADPAASLAGLQTRSQTAQMIQERVGAGGGMQQLQQNVDAARAQLNSLKERTGSNSELEMPDFKPNKQKTKSFLQRIEFGGNLQSNRANGFLPTTTDIAASMGYKLNDKSIIGIGAGYKLGWGRSLRNIRFTHEGISLRTFIDWKLKYGIFISGGAEANYFHQFTTTGQLRNFDAWQKSGLIGLTKKYKVSKKLSGSFQALYNLLHRKNYPNTQPVIIRFGYQFNK